MASPKPVVHVADSGPALASTVYDYIVERSDKAVKDHGFFSIGLSGGSVAKLVADGMWKKKNVDWAAWRVFFCDERHVSLDSDDSNYKSLRTFFEKVKTVKSVCVPL